MTIMTHITVYKNTLMFNQPPRTALLLPVIGGAPPVDAFIEQEVNYTINLALYYVMVLFAVFGLILATLFITFNIRYRNRR